MLPRCIVFCAARGCYDVVMEGGVYFNWERIDNNLDAGRLEQEVDRDEERCARVASEG